MKKFILSVLAFGPMFAFAATPQLGGLFDLTTTVGKLVDKLLPLLVGIALLGFFYGLAKFIFSAGDEDARKEARSIMIYGVIALFVMVSVWGLVNFVGSALGVAPGESSGTIPSVKGL